MLAVDLEMCLAPLHVGCLLLEMLRVRQDLIVDYGRLVLDLRHRQLNLDLQVYVLLQVSLSRLGEVLGLEIQIIDCTRRLTAPVPLLIQIHNA